MSSLSTLLAVPVPETHLVQFFGDEGVLARNVAVYLKEGAERGEWMIVVATPSHLEAFSRLLKAYAVDVDGLVRSGRLIVHDAETTLARSMTCGQPDWAKFDALVGQLIRDVKAVAGDSGIRAYGEMVDLLWKAGQLSAATRLEEYWNKILRAYRFRLFCAYTVDLLGSEDQTSAIQEMLQTHTHLLPVRSNGELEGAVSKAMEEVLGGATVGALLPLIRATQYSWAELPDAEANILWLRKHLPPYASQVLARARVHYEALCQAHVAPGDKAT